MPRPWFLLAFLAAAPVRADEPPPVSALVEEILRPLVDSGDVAGMSVGIIDGDETYVFGLGTTNRAKDKGVTPDGRTVYEIGSISKVFTGTILADMVNKGEVALDDPVAKLVPEGVTVPEKNGKVITLEDLATHRSGLPRLPDNMPPNPFDPYAGYSSERMFEFLSRHELRREPGEKAEYSNYAVGLLGELLRRRAGAADYEALMIERIAGPLGMNETRVALNDAMRERFAQGYGGMGLPSGPWDLAAFAGAGGIRSTVDDMLKFARAALHPDDTPLGRAFKEATTPRRDFEGGGTRIGLNWIVFPDGTVFHNGQTGGYHCFLAFRPDAGVAVVILTNSSSGRTDGAGRALLGRLVERHGSTPAADRD